MEYEKERLVELLLTIDEEATLLLGADGRHSPRRYREMVSIYEDYARRHGHAPDA